MAKSNAPLLAFLPSAVLQNLPVFIRFIYDTKALDFLSWRHHVIMALVTGEVFELQISFLQRDNFGGSRD